VDEYDKNPIGTANKKEGVTMADLHSSQGGKRGTKIKRKFKRKDLNDLTRKIGGRLGDRSSEKKRRRKSKKKRKGKDAGSDQTGPWMQDVGGKHGFQEKRTGGRIREKKKEGKGNREQIPVTKQNFWEAKKRKGLRGRQRGGGRSIGKLLSAEEGGDGAQHRK